MWGRIGRILLALLSIALLIGAFIGTDGVSDGSKEQAMLPPCSVDEGLPLIDDDEVTCYWGMSCLLYTSPSPRDGLLSRMPSSA